MVMVEILIHIITAVFLISLTPVILSIAELSPVSQGYLKWMIVVCAINLIGMSNNSAIISGIFPAGGDTKFGFICDCITLWLIVVPLGMLGAFVWKLEPSGKEGEFTVKRRMVKLGRRVGVQIEVVEGLADGDRIASAGVNILSEGRKVVLYRE